MAKSGWRLSVLCCAVAREIEDGRLEDAARTIIWWFRDYLILSTDQITTNLHGSTPAQSLLSSDFIIIIIIIIIDLMCISLQVNLQRLRCGTCDGKRGFCGITGGAHRTVWMVNSWYYGWRFLCFTDGRLLAVWMGILSPYGRSYTCDVRKVGPRGRIYSLRGNLVLYSRDIPALDS
jgi:hypothetical protein